jgi:hypothetical protein
MLRQHLNFAVMLLATLALPARAADNSTTPPVSCANGLVGGINCIPTKKDLKEAREAFARGLKTRSF